MTLTAIYFTGRAARRASNTAIDFTHVATNNHALPYGTVGTNRNHKHQKMQCSSDRRCTHHTRHRGGAQLLSAHRIPRANHAALDVPPNSN